ncbi:hypothetical protein [Pedobacter xixiisoli]|uniref:Uncharacterized protein n=1 Tax=Pedobacter xixiisoli TaxID=1476464 RepID=A0A286A6F8_9SPHI|nr:hypothetical protein [Pedobacter xixiisoli]SOD17467.1 hypothetical protein SAMN06297358_2545 [Pedobacter xixiisoli]
MKRALTSLCGILLIASLIYTTSNSGINPNEQSASTSGVETFFEGSILSLNVLFLVIFLVSILTMIKEEDKNEKDNTLL